MLIFSLLFGKSNTHLWQHLLQCLGQSGFSLSGRWVFTWFRSTRQSLQLSERATRHRFGNWFYGWTYSSRGKQIPAWCHLLDWWTAWHSSAYGGCWVGWGSIQSRNNHHRWAIQWYKVSWENEKAFVCLILFFFLCISADCSNVKRIELCLLIPNIVFTTNVLRISREQLA